MALLKTLWGAETGTPEGGKLDLLITLLDLYESARYPFELPDPRLHTELEIPAEVLIQPIRPAKDAA